MRILFTTLCFFASLLLWTCQNIEDASPSNRETFIRLYEGPYSITATDFETIPNGYVILGNMSVPPDGRALDSVVTVVFQVDKRGRRISDFNYFLGGTGKSIKHHPDGGYVIVGDSIKRDLNPTEGANGLISSSRIILLDEDFRQVFKVTRSDNSENSIKADFYGGSVTIDNAKNVIILGTYVAGVGTQSGVPERPFIISYTKSGNSLNENWERNYPLIDRNYKNSRSVHSNENVIIWASSIARIQGDVTFSYVSIPYVQSNSQFLNASTIGEARDQLLVAADIQPSKLELFGYGVVGTYSESTDGSKSNMCFFRVDPSGSIIERSERFFDAILSESNTVLSDNTQSQIIDEGKAIAATSDGGFVLAGSIHSIPGKGNGGRDIYLVKVNALGDPLWNKVIGGSGDEVVCSIKETEDGGLLILGTNTLGGASSPFLLKTDKDGELKN